MMVWAGDVWTMQKRSENSSIQLGGADLHEVAN
jgi:hypothetical protein